MESFTEPEERRDYLSWFFSVVATLAVCASIIGVIHQGRIQQREAVSDAKVAAYESGHRDGRCSALKTWADRGSAIMQDLYETECE